MALADAIGNVHSMMPPSKSKPHNACKTNSVSDNNRSAYIYVYTGKALLHKFICG